MIEANAESKTADKDLFEGKLTGLVLGVGGAGGKIVDALSGSPCAGLKYLALDSDVQALEQLSHCSVIQLGKKTVRGFGTGASLELAQSLVEEEKEALEQLPEGCSLLFLVVGLGGGLGGGLAPIIAQLAAKAGLFVVAISVFPFDCEGIDRRVRALFSQNEMTKYAHLHISLSNELLASQAGEDANFLELYGVSNRMIADAVEGLWLSFYHPGPLPLDLGLLRNSFAFAEGKCMAALAVASTSVEGKGRVEALYERLLEHPWLKKGALLRSAGSVLALFIGQEALTPMDAEFFQRRIASENPAARIIMAACTASKNADEQLRVVLITHPRRATPEEIRQSPAKLDKEQVSLNEVDREMIEKKRPPTRRVPPPPTLTDSQIEHILKLQTSYSVGRSRRGYNDPNQGVLDLQITSVGRFDSCEKTYYKGQQMDVPTFFRLGYKLE